MESTSTAGKRVAFFGGSFDPPHEGHLAVARAARATLALDSVLFAPVGAQPLKPQGSTAGFEDRLAMTRLAIADEPGFAVSLADAPRPSAAPNYTLDTLLHLRIELAPGGILFCLMGADSFLGLRRWHRSAEIPFVAPLIVASRPGQPLDGLRDALPLGLTMEAASGVVPGAPVRPDPAVEVRTFILRNGAGENSPFFLLPGLDIEISASRIRGLIRGGAREAVVAAPESPDAGRRLVPIAVLNYIRAHRLYR
ncbi:MAG TPA: nicotinate-nucleotide adenylyltransferase [Terracidiphilus sp.]|jgi:nicotinate-nucleotide adenylyltransferase|nr:nicotinate-nucleotide adenylyltransferase [Terracidiphilus sp.]